MGSRFAGSLIFTFAMVLVSGLLGCEDKVRGTTTASILVEPEELVFPKPELGQDSRFLTLTIRNVGRGPLLIDEITLEENDDVKELTLLDADDWSSDSAVVELLADEDVVVSVSWRMRDAQADEAKLIIVHNAGEPTEVPITTPDIDPLIGVVTDPEGEESDGETTVELTRATPGLTERVKVELTSQSVAPLDVSRICLLDSAGECSETQSDPAGAFTVCDGTPLNTDECNPPEVGEPIAYEESYNFVIFFSPPAGSTNNRVGKILIESNSARSPQYQVKVRGEPCFRQVEGDVCNTCGNGTVDTGEECDDGNVIDNDDCRNNCLAPACGDGIVNGEELCDDGNDTDGDGCDTNCTETGCGNGIVTTNETCDDGNAIDGDGCDTNCTETSCGNGIVTTGEACDDGNNIPGDGCNVNCDLPVCGDGRLDPGEECDVGGPTVTCDVDCTLVACGDGTVNALANEQCDDGGESASCNADCTAARCGDGIINQSAGEQCDNPLNPTGCANCRLASAGGVCGNGIVEPANGEQCDAGGLSAACNLNCQFSRCGDGVVNALANEQCDDGAATDRCTADCRNALCGDGMLNAGEECDDRGASRTCDVDCTFARCGDGLVNFAAMEQCDDGSQTATCDLDCTFAQCGDGVVNPAAGEECEGGPDCMNCQSECIEDELMTGSGLYGDPCSRGADCATGRCIPNPHGTSLGRCSQECENRDQCPGIDLCVRMQYPPPQSRCDPAPAAGPAFINICWPNETGVVCDPGCSDGDILAGRSDCCYQSGSPAGSPICLTPPQVAGGATQPYAVCASVCRRDSDCPSDYTCDFVRDALGTPTNTETICIPRVRQMIPCGAASNYTINDDGCNISEICPIAETSFCLSDSYCSCACLNSTHCPDGYACFGRVDGLQPEPGICVPVAGFACTGLEQNPMSVCYSGSCSYDPNADTPGHCSSLCLNSNDCPVGFDCNAVDNSPDRYCERQ